MEILLLNFNIYFPKDKKKFQVVLLFYDRLGVRDVFGKNSIFCSFKLTVRGSLTLTQVGFGYVQER